MQERKTQAGSDNIILSAGTTSFDDIHSGINRPYNFDLKDALER